MSNLTIESSNPISGRVIPIKRRTDSIAPTSLVSLPVSEESKEIYSHLNQVSSFKSEFDWTPIEDLERRSLGKNLRGGILFRTPFKLVNHHSTCTECLYAFEIDTYGRGCVHNCVYCYAKAQLTVYGFWNNPYPAPVDIAHIRKTFFTVFETDRPNRWRQILEKRIPIRIGSMSDSFMWMDDKYKVSQELIKILNYYNYPFVIFTRSDLIARDDYLSLLDRKNSSVQFSISSTNDQMNKLMEPGAPSAKRRLSALKKLNEAGVWTAVRINPLFPIYPDGYFTNPNFKRSGLEHKFDYFSFEMVDEIAATKTPAILAGFGRFSSFALNQITKAVGFDLRTFFAGDSRKSVRDYHFSDEEIRYYYEEIQKRCKANGIQFTTCYIGNGESHFWKDQDLWSNKKDCCNIADRVAGFSASCREIPMEDRLKFKTAVKKKSENLVTAGLTISPIPQISNRETAEGYPR